MQVSGTQALPASTRALDFQLAQYAAIVTTPPGLGVVDATGILIKENGIIFYRLNFTTANHTFVYNVTQSNPESDQTKFWHEEQDLNGNRHPAQTHTFVNGINYYGNYKAPIKYSTDPSFLDNDGEPIERMRIGRAFVPPGYQRTRVDRFQLDLIQGSVQDVNFIGDDVDLLTETGIEILTESGLDILTESSDRVFDNAVPVVFLSISKDGGITYGNELPANMGKIGQRTFRTVWRKLGVTPRGQAFVPRVKFYNNVPFAVFGASWAYEILPE
jgi:hypothetical protein